MAARVGFLGSKGGVGTTTVAVHFADAWARAGMKPCLRAEGSDQTALQMASGTCRLFRGDDPSVSLTEDRDFQVLDLGVGPCRTELDALVVVTNCLPESLARAHAAVLAAPEGLACHLLVNASVRGADGPAVLAEAERLCARFGSRQASPLGVVPLSRSVGRWCQHGQTAFECSPWAPVCSALRAMASDLHESLGRDQKTPEVDLHEVRTGRAA
jgi:hypothetical protein